MDDDDIPNESVKRYELYEWALYERSLLQPADPDAVRMFIGHTQISAMARRAFINATINNVPAVLRKIAPSYPGIDVVGLAKRVCLDVVIMRLEE